jgi:hypothetical protein
LAFVFSDFFSPSFDTKQVPPLLLLIIPNLRFLTMGVVAGTCHSSHTHIQLDPWTWAVVNPVIDESELTS